jgi:UDP-N-acetylmuramoyl-tripeptide--D-alanyl-D-alanine ligase
MNNYWSADEIIEATGGKLIGDDNFTATGFAMDSRDVKSGDLFIALQPEGDTDQYRSQGQDGHNFIPSAIKNGAVAVIVSKKMNIDIPQIIVPDTFKAMVDFGQYTRNNAALNHIIGITGSVGKTGVRNLAETAFASVNDHVHASIKSYNNAIGVPFTLCNLQKNTEILVSEMGMNHAGEIEKLSHQVRPSIAIITWISEQHIENFDNGIDGIVSAKSELFIGMDTDGMAILPLDNDYYHDLYQNAQKQRLSKIYSFGEHTDADAKLLNYRFENGQAIVTANIMGDDVDYTLSMAGKHNAMNSLCALLAVKLAGYDVKIAAQSLAQLCAVKGRGNIETIAIDAQGQEVILIDDSYNAAPAAMVAAFHVLSTINPKGDGRRIAMLGQMAELGADAKSIHENLADPFINADIDLAYCCGVDIKPFYDLIPESKQGGHYQSSTDLHAMIKDIIKPNDVLLVKGSNGSNMKIIIEAIQSLHA